MRPAAGGPGDRLGPQGTAGQLRSGRGRPVAGRGNPRSSVGRLAVRFAQDTRGATAIEYAMIAGLISIAAVGALTVMGPAIADLFTRASAPF
ncbi:MAG: Flp family type IVb pilin [Pseudomonadota bacterium]|nr:Flp family type IVb pilin [Pseudomonadota bacterium]